MPSPDLVLEALERLETVNMTGLLVLAVGLGFIVLCAAWIALQGMRR